MVKPYVLNKPFYLTTMHWPFGKISLFHAQLSLCPCVRHNMTNEFACKHNPTSRQYGVNIGQNQVELPKI
jgi:hypothetical protein